MTAWLIETGIAVTILMLLVLAVRRPVAHFFGAGWAYALWLLPVLRLVLPPLHLFGNIVPSLLPAAPANIPAATAAAPRLQAAMPFEWEPLLLALWLAGSVAFILWQSVSYVAFTRRLGIGSQVHASLAQDVGIIESAEVDGPLAIGLLDRWIVVPADFSVRYTPQEQQLALRHERVHHQREDIFWNMAALGILALNWFNPIAYVAFRAFRADQELSCDAAVAAMASAEERHDYARALVKSASRPGLIAACPLNHAGQLKQRLRMMRSHRRSRGRAIGGSAAAAVLVLAGLSATESAGVAAAEAAPLAPPASSAPRVALAPVQEPKVEAALVPAAPESTGKASAPRAAKPAPARIAAAAMKAPKSAPAPVPASVPAAPAAAPTPPAGPVPAHAAAPPAIVVRIEDPRRFAFLARHMPFAKTVHVIRTDTGPGAQVPEQLKDRLEAWLASRTVSGTSAEIHTIRSIHVKEN